MTEYGAARSEATLYTPAWVARRLGISAGTLRSWHHRYQLAPSARTAGGHRRYLPEDLEALERMTALVAAGVPAAEAARRSRVPASAPPSASPTASGAPRRSDRQEPGLRLPAAGGEARAVARAVLECDQAVTSALLTEGLARHGVVGLWDRVAVPVLVAVGRRWARTGACIDGEHLLTECLRSVLITATLRRARPTSRPVVLAAAADETHTLPLYALAAALADRGVPALQLGAGLPARSLTATLDHTAARAVFVWAQTADTARHETLEALETLAAPRPSLTLVLGGPGWGRKQPPAGVVARSLSEAVEHLLGFSSTGRSSGR